MGPMAPGSMPGPPGTTMAPGMGDMPGQMGGGMGGMPWCASGRLRGGMPGQMGMLGGGMMQPPMMQPPMGMVGAMGGLINPATIVGDVSLLDKTGSGAAVPSGTAAPDLEELLNRLGLRDKLLPKLLENDIDSVAELRLLTEDDFKEMGISIGIRRKLLEEMGKSPQSPAAPSGGGGGFGFVSGGGMPAPPPMTASAGNMFGGMALASAMPPAPPAAPAGDMFGGMALASAMPAAPPMPQYGEPRVLDGPQFGENAWSGTGTSIAPTYGPARDGPETEEEKKKKSFFGSGKKKTKEDEKKDKIDSELGASLMKVENTITAKPPAL